MIFSDLNAALGPHEQMNSPCRLSGQHVPSMYYGHYRISLSAGQEILYYNDEILTACEIQKPNWVYHCVALQCYWRHWLLTTEWSFFFIERGCWELNTIIVYNMFLPDPSISQISKCIKQNGALWDICQMHCGIGEMGLVLYVIRWHNFYVF